MKSLSAQAVGGLAVLQRPASGGKGSKGGNKFDCIRRKGVIAPHKVLCGGIPCPCLEPLARSWSHFVGIYRQKLMKSSKTDF